MANPTRVLITGYAGFAGRHLLPALAAEQCEVWGLDRLPPPAGATTLAGHFTGDITDYDLLRLVVDQVRPDLVFHLAAITFGRPDGPEDRRFFTVNVDGTRLLIEALLAAGQAPRVLVTGSSAIYGAPPRASQPIVEETPLRPQTLYAASKASQELIALTYARTHGLPVMVTRAFNHTGPGEPPQFACSSFARQIAEIEAGRRQPPLKVGNLEAWRDFADARDVARGYINAARNGEPGECYNVCSGVARRMADILQELLARSDHRIAVELDPERLQPSDVPYQCGSHAKLTAAGGWEPEIDFGQTLDDLLGYWRDRIGSSPVDPGSE